RKSPPPLRALASFVARASSALTPLTCSKSARRSATRSSPLRATKRVTPHRRSALTTAAIATSCLCPCASKTIQHTEKNYGNPWTYHSHFAFDQFPGRVVCSRHTGGGRASAMPVTLFVNKDNRD